MTSQNIEIKLEFNLEKAMYCEAEGIIPSYAVPYDINGERAGVKIMDIGTYAALQDKAKQENNSK